MGADAWRAWAGAGSCAPVSLATEGFVHCTAGDELMLAVANAVFGVQPGDFVAVTIDADLLTSDVRWEPPAHPDGRAGGPGDPLFPHVYGPLEGGAVTGVRRVRRDGDGRFVGYAEMA
jgi:uncharacterized protein (DUF952 family)